jgi:ribosomal protein L24E
MIKIILKDEHYCPVVLCDLCEDSIGKGDGMARWFRDGSMVHFVCKKCIAGKPDRVDLTEELDVFFEHLRNNVESKYADVF